MTTKVKNVEAISPPIKETAIGVNIVPPFMAKGMSPIKVVMVDKRIGRVRRSTAATQASSNSTP